MLAIKLRRIGKKHQPSFRIIVAEKRSKVNGRFVEDLGFVNRIEKKYSINKERALYWLKMGAQPTEVVHNLFVKEGIINAPKIPVHKNPKKGKEEVVNTTEKNVAENAGNEENKEESENTTV